MSAIRQRAWINVHALTLSASSGPPPALLHAVRHGATNRGDYYGGGMLCPTCAARNLPWLSAFVHREQDVSLALLVTQQPAQDHLSVGRAHHGAALTLAPSATTAGVTTIPTSAPAPMTTPAPAETPTPPTSTVTSSPEQLPHRAGKRPSTENATALLPALPLSRTHINNHLSTG
ncbi:hypothetical protein [Nonomuraea sp. NPDC049684]|uniref:hypothetical protein n=1 Tax=Nonomuraea sp. NPDC049684 TaxID=3364356 RepID=UPI00378C1900